MIPQIFREPVVIDVGSATVTLLGYTKMEVTHEYEKGRTWNGLGGNISMTDNDRVVGSTLTFEVTPKPGQPYLYEVRKNGLSDDHAHPGRRLQGETAQNKGASPDSGVLRKRKRDDPSWYHKAAQHRRDARSVQ